MIEVKVNPYRDKLESLLKKVRPRLSSTHNLEFKKCFGAVAGYVNGNIFISCGKFGVALKLPPEALAMLFKEKGLKPLKYFPNGHVKKEYAVLSQHILNEPARLKKLVNKSIKFSQK
jgi:TfoX/Sxy family transcriptional regulator of competence genes